MHRFYIIFLSLVIPALLFAKTSSVPAEKTTPSEEQVFILRLSGGGAAAIALGSEEKGISSNGPAHGKHFVPVVNIHAEYGVLYNGKFMFSGVAEAHLYRGYIPVITTGVGGHFGTAVIRDRGSSSIEFAGLLTTYFIDGFSMGYGWTLGYDYTVFKNISAGADLRAVTLFGISGGDNTDVSYFTTYELLAGITIWF